MDKLNNSNEECGWQKKEDLNDLREEIDIIDKEIVNLLEKRFEISLKVANYKKLNNLPIFHKEREKEVIQNALLKLKNKEFSLEVEELFSHLMLLSKKIQEKHIKDSK